jgi:hypothetical protein
MYAYPVGIYSDFLPYRSLLLVNRKTVNWRILAVDKGFLMYTRSMHKYICPWSEELGFSISSLPAFHMIFCPEV